MSESATSVRERRKAATRDELTRVARRLTAEHGLQGFTIEELCDEVGVSRRTFFNYFGGKEEAVVGQNDEFIDTAFAEEFVHGGSGAGISDDLLPALVLLAARHIEELHPSPEESAHLVAAITREPKLLERFSSVGERRHRLLAELVEQREGLPSGDQRAEAAVRLLDAIVHWAGASFVAPGNTTPFHEHIEQSLELALQVMPRPVGGPSRKDPGVSNH